MSSALPTNNDDSPPPILGRWSRLYALVLISLGVLVALLSVITQVYR